MLAVDVLEVLGRLAHFTRRTGVVALVNHVRASFKLGFGALQRRPLVLLVLRP